MKGLNFHQMNQMNQMKAYCKYSNFFFTKWIHLLHLVDYRQWVKIINS
jgi:hypothetical protein